MVVGEGSLIALVGGVLGCAMAGGLCAAVAAAMSGAPGFMSVVKGLSLTPLTAALTLLIALLIGLTSSVVPALTAARTSILEALSFSG